MTININSEKFCREAYINACYNNNTMGLTPDEIGAISAKWESKLKTWNDIGAQGKDETFYDTSDESWDDGRKYAQDSTNYDGDDTGNRWNVGLSTAGSALGTAAAITGAVQTGSNIIKGAEGFLSTTYSAGTRTLSHAGGLAKDFKDVGETVETTNFSKAAGQGAESRGPSAFVYVAAALTIATATMYRIIKPNEKEVTACEELKNNVLPQANAALEGSQGDMQEATTELQTLQEEAAEVNDAANAQMEEDKATYDTYKVRYDKLKANVDAGESLTEGDKAEFKKLQKYMGVVAENIQGAQDDATSQVGAIYEDMESFESKYADAADTIGETEGVTEFAEGFDKATRTGCYVEGASQTINAVSGVITGSQLTGMGFWNWALAALTFAAAGLSGFNAKEQFQNAGKVDAEIDLREQTQEFTETTIGVYNDEYDAFDGLKTGVEDLELEVPEDTEAPQDVDIPAGDTTSGDAKPVGLKKNPEILQ